jgi:hypothetical protein
MCYYKNPARRHLLLICALSSDIFKNDIDLFLGEPRCLDRTLPEAGIAASRPSDPAENPVETLWNTVNLKS